MTVGEATDATEVLGEGWMRASAFRERRMSSTFEPQVFRPRRVEYGDLAKGTLRPPLIPTYPRSADPRNARWRVCFRWTDDGPAEVEIVDYRG